MAEDRFRLKQATPPWRLKFATFLRSQMKKYLVLLKFALAQMPGLDLYLPSVTGSAQEEPGVSSFNPSGAFQAGRGTYYGPNPLYPPGNEPGYRKLDVGVGCSTGGPSGDSRWKQILSLGVKVNPLDPENVWPTVPTVAVSEAAWGKSLCWQTVVIRNRLDPSKTITATVVDACPVNGCLWSKSELAYNVDIYGIDSYMALGGDKMGGKLDLEIMWPAGFVPKSSALQASIKFFLVIPLIFIIV